MKIQMVSSGLAAKGQPLQWQRHSPGRRVKGSIRAFNQHRCRSNQPCYTVRVQRVRHLLQSMPLQNSLPEEEIEMLPSLSPRQTLPTRTTHCYTRTEVARNWSKSEATGKIKMGSLTNSDPVG